MSPLNRLRVPAAFPVSRESSPASDPTGLCLCVRQSAGVRVAAPPAGPSGAALRDPGAGAAGATAGLQGRRERREPQQPHVLHCQSSGEAPPSTQRDSASPLTKPTSE